MVFRKLKKNIIKYTPSRIKSFFANELIEEYKENLAHTQLSYSQEGEDLILSRFFEDKRVGFYIDVGAHHPKRFSNTYIFYKKGWTGINIDANPNSMSIFNRVRNRDINLEIGVAKEERELTYYRFNEPALNTFSSEEAYKKNGLRNFKIVEEKIIKTLPLRKILQDKLKETQEIDFMSVDVEGLDLEVLESNDWDRYRPKYLLVEDLNKYEIKDLINESKVYKFLVVREYSLVAKTFNTLFFKDCKAF